MAGRATIITTNNATMVHNREPWAPVLPAPSDLARRGRALSVCSFRDKIILMTLANSGRLRRRPCLNINHTATANDEVRIRMGQFQQEQTSTIREGTLTPNFAQPILKKFMLCIQTKYRLVIKMHCHRKTLICNSLNWKMHGKNTMRRFVWLKGDTMTAAAKGIKTIHKTMNGKRKRILQCLELAVRSRIVQKNATFGSRSRTKHVGGGFHRARYHTQKATPRNSIQTLHWNNTLFVIWNWVTTTCLYLPSNRWLRREIHIENISSKMYINSRGIDS